MAQIRCEQSCAVIVDGRGLGLSRGRVYDLPAGKAEALVAHGLASAVEPEPEPETQSDDKTEVEKAPAKPKPRGKSAGPAPENK